MFCVSISSERGSVRDFAAELCAAFAEAGSRAQTAIQADPGPASDVGAALLHAAQLASFWKGEVSRPVAAGAIVIVNEAAGDPGGPVPPEVLRRIQRIAQSECPPSYSATVLAGPGGKRANQFDGTDPAKRKAQMAIFAKGCLNHHQRQNELFARVSK